MRKPKNSIEILYFSLGGLLLLGVFCTVFSPIANKGVCYEQVTTEQVEQRTTSKASAKVKDIPAENVDVKIWRENQALKHVNSGGDDKTDSQQPTLVDVTIVVPTYKAHYDPLERFMQSMVKFCNDCHTVEIDWIIVEEDKELFSRLRAAFPQFRINLKIFEKIAPFWLSGKTPGQLLAEVEKVAYQSFKKLTGCANTTTTYCWLFDSETLFIRNTSIHGILADYLADPFIVHSRSRTTHVSTIIAKQVLDIPRRNYGWLLQYYFWFFKRSDALAAEQLLRREKSLKNYKNFMVEVLLYMKYMEEANGTVRILTVEQDIIPDFDALQEIIPRAFGALEDLRKYIHELPWNTLFKLSTNFVKNNLVLFKPSKEGTLKELAFIERTSSIHFLVSSDVPDYYHMAMHDTFK